MINIQDKSIKTRYNSAKSRINKLSQEAKNVSNSQELTGFIGKVVTLENYIYSKIDPFYRDAANELIDAIKEIRLDAEHYLNQSISRREYLASASEVESRETQAMKNYKAECRLAAALAGY